jgi:hypothetical protein
MLMWWLLLSLACSNDKPAAEEGDTGTPDPNVSEWTGGNFQFQTVDVRDSCLGGAFEVLFMPEGPATPHDFQYLIYIPDYSDLPELYTIDLRDPFVEMPVSVDAPDGQTYQIRGAVMDAVELGATAYGDCVATMTVDADITPFSKDSATGTATISISDPRGSDGRCPVFEETPCEVKLVLKAYRD